MPSPSESSPPVYSGLTATTWDVWRDETAAWSDRPFFLEILRGYGSPVLDLGCGTGRLLLDYLAEGVDIDGVDNSAEMLDICRDKAHRRDLPSPGLHQQCLQDLDLPRRYRTILGASSILQLVTDPDTAVAALRRIYDHLLPGGALVGSFSFEWRPGEPLDTGWELLFQKRRPDDGASVRCWTREWREPETQLWHTEQRFEVQRAGKVIDRQLYRRSPEGCWYTQEQAVLLFRSANFVNIQVLHEFTRAPAGAADRLFCVLGERPVG